VARGRAGNPKQPGGSRACTSLHCRRVTERAVGTCTPLAPRAPCPPPDAAARVPPREPRAIRTGFYRPFPRSLCRLPAGHLRGCPARRCPPPVMGRVRRRRSPCRSTLRPKQLCSFSPCRVSERSGSRFEGGRSTLTCVAARP
jgi:hypothetical protein